MDHGSTSRDRSPLKYPAAANMSFAPALSQPTLDQDHFGSTTTAPSFDQALFEQELAQQLNDPSFNATLSNNAINTSMTHSSFDPNVIDLPNQNHLSPHSLSNHTSPAPQDNLNFTPFDFNQDITLDTDLALLNQAQQHNTNNFNSGGTSAGGNLNTMSAVTHSPTPPHLLPRNSNSPSPHASPANQHSPFAPMGRPRNTSESLDPLSAAYPQRSSGDWSNMGAYRGHRRVPSDNLSDISSHSNQASPYLATLESFESANQASPLLDASQDPMLGDALGIGHFTLNDQQSTVQPGFHNTPGHSPHISPRLMPQQQQQQQQPLPVFTADNNFGLNTNLSPQFPLQSNGFDMFSSVSEPFPAVSGHEIGQADHMSPPEINIDYAPSLKPVDAPRLSAHGGDLNLTPPTRPARNRAKSASHADVRPPTPSIISRGRSPSLQPNIAPDTLSPLSAHRSFSNSPSRSNSPHRGRAGSLTDRGRSTSSTSDRGKILDLANPERSPSNGGEGGRRPQKHPANFECHLCPKRFTRAYNLRSHLRTHTDERPFVCTVCGKAFARQHDRKRHEGLHSGEKKFVCRGPLKNGEQWGCSRRFARADALGRHFRSEAGRVCIRPLLEEEAAEQQAANNSAWMEQQSNSFDQPQPQQGVDFGGSNFLPARILEQYPALAVIDWSSAAAQSGADDDSYGGRTSFDASSGGEMYDDLSEGEFVDPGPAMGLGVVGQGFPLDAHQQHRHQQQGIDPFGMGEYTNGLHRQ